MEGRQLSYSTRASLIFRIRNPEDVDAWSQFADIYGPLIHRYACRRGLQDADAADLTQEVLSEVSKSIRKNNYDPKRGSFRNWLFGIARHLLCHRLRQNQRRFSVNGNSRVQEFFNELPSADRQPDWDSEYRHQLFNWAADQVRGHFGNKTWMAFWRTAIDGAKPKDVARELNMSVGAVYVSKNRVLSRLRRKIATIYDGYDR